MPFALTSLRADQYADWSEAFPYVARDGTPEDITGYTALFMVRKYVSDAVPVLSVSSTPSSNGSATVTGSPASVVVSLAGAALGALAQGIYQFGLLLVAPSGAVTPYLAGPFVVSPGFAH